MTALTRAETPLTSASGEFGVCAAIPRDVAVKLPRPPVFVCFRSSRVFGAAVPETPIDEDNQVQSFPHDVGFAFEVGLGPSIYPVPDPARMQDLPDKQLGLSVTTALFAHL